MPTDAEDEERRVLLHFLQYQRDSVLAIVAGLSEEAWHTSVVPSGWTPAGFIDHLGGAERHWFQQVIKGSEDDLPWDEGLPAYDAEAAFTSDRSSTDILAYYREQCARSDAVLAGVSLSAAPAGKPNDPELEDAIPSVRWVVLHMIEETAAPSGHLEIAREMLDGRTNLGLR